jgi:hypothetical protein
MWIWHARSMPARWFSWSSRAWCAFVGVIFASLGALLVLTVAGAMLSRPTFASPTVLIVWTVLYAGWVVRALTVVLAVDENDVMVRNPLRTYRFWPEMVEVIHCGRTAGLQGRGLPRDQDSRPAPLSVGTGVRSVDANWRAAVGGDRSGAA